MPDTISVKGKKYKVTSIGTNAFKGNKTIKSVKLGDNVITIAGGAFSGCKKLKSIVIGKNLTSIGKKVSKYKKILKSVKKIVKI